MCYLVAKRFDGKGCLAMKVKHGKALAESGEPIYQCPDLYLVRDLASISWGTEEDSVLLTQKDGSSVTYVRTGDRWEKVSR